MFERSRVGSNLEGVGHLVDFNCRLRDFAIGDFRFHEMFNIRWTPDGPVEVSASSAVEVEEQPIAQGQPVQAPEPEPVKSAETPSSEPASEPMRQWKPEEL